MKISDAFNILDIKQQTATIEEIKKAYKKASLKYHPDRNEAGLLIMQAINAAYTFLISLKHDPILSYADDQEPVNFYNYSDELSRVLNQIYDLKGLDIEICGNWIWVGGSTKEHKDILKSLDFKWAKVKKLWFFRPDEYKCFTRKTKSMEEIRATYGSNKKFYSKNNYLSAS